MRVHKGENNTMKIRIGIPNIHGTKNNYVDRHSLSGSAHDDPSSEIFPCPPLRKEGIRGQGKVAI